MTEGVWLEKRSAEEKYRLFIEAVTDYALYMLDPQGRVVSWNPGAQRFKGYREAEILGQHFSRFYTEEDRNSGLPARALDAARARTGPRSIFPVAEDGGDRTAHGRHCP